MKKNILREENRKRYIKISNDYLYDKNLSWRSKGLNSYILSKQDNWEVVVKHIMNKHEKGEVYVRSSRDELIKSGYWFYRRLRKKTGECEKSVTLVYDQKREKVEDECFKKKKKIYRTIEDKNYTFLTCYHLDDNRLSLEAKGIHSYILSRPNEWEVNVDHLVKMGTEGESVVKKAVNELINYGYIQRYRIFRNGRVSKFKKIASEKPFSEDERIKSIIYSENKKKINYVTGHVVIEAINKKANQNNKPTKEIGESEISNSNIKQDKDKAQCEKQPSVELFKNQDEVNQKEENKEQINQELSNTIYLNNTKKNNLSLLKDDKIDINIFKSKDDIKKQIEYSILVEEYGPEILDPLVNVIYKVLNWPKEYISISNVLYPSQEVKNVYESLNSINVIDTINSVLSIKTVIKNLSSYLQTTLYNNFINNDLDIKNKFNATNENIDDALFDENVEDETEEFYILSTYEDFLKEIKNGDFDDKKNEGMEDKELEEFEDIGEVSIRELSISDFTNNLPRDKKSLLQQHIKKILLKKDKIQIEAKSSFSKTVLEKRYLDLIFEVFKDEDLEIVFTC